MDNNEEVYEIGIYKIYRVSDSSMTVRKSINSPHDASTIAKEYLSGHDQEHFIAILLDTKNQIIGVQTVTIGTVNASQGRISEALRPAVIANAPAIIFAHNHPSGDTTPSPNDIAVTRALVKAGELLGIQVLDHIIVSDGASHVSMKERRLGFN